MWHKIIDKHVELRILAKPNAKKSAFVAVSDQGLHIMLHAKPHHGEANKELVAYLANLFELPKSQIILQKGERGRNKQVIVPLTEIVQRFLDDPLQFIS